MFNNIHGLLEAKVLLKHLYNSGVQYLLDLKLKQLQYDTTTSGILLLPFVFLNSTTPVIQTTNNY